MDGPPDYIEIVSVILSKRSHVQVDTEDDFIYGKFKNLES